MGRFSKKRLSTQSIVFEKKSEMKLSGIVLLQAALAKTDVHFNHDHDIPEVAQLEKWNGLAQKFFRHHGADLRKPFLARWGGGKKGRFEREIKKLEQAYARKCSEKDTTSVRSSYSTVEDTDDSKTDDSKTDDSKTDDSKKHRQSSDSLSERTQVR